MIRNLKMLKKISFMLLSLILVGVALVGSKYFTDMGMQSWYPAADKTPLTPPDYVFPIAWAFIYATLLIAGYRILYYRAESNILILFVMQLSLQVLWCMTFFAMQNALMGLLVILMLDATVFLMLMRLRKRDILSARLLYFYFAWLLFATYLNLGFIF